MLHIAAAGGWAPLAGGKKESDKRKKRQLPHSGLNARSRNPLFSALALICHNWCHVCLTPPIGAQEINFKLKGSAPIACNRGTLTESEDGEVGMKRK